MRRARVRVSRAYRLRKLLVLVADAVVPRVPELLRPSQVLRQRHQIFSGVQCLCALPMATSVITNRKRRKNAAISTHFGREGGLQSELILLGNIFRARKNICVVVAVPDTARFLTGAGKWRGGTAATSRELNGQSSYRYSLFGAVAQRNSDQYAQGHHAAVRCAASSTRSRRVRVARPWLGQATASTHGRRW